MTYTLKLTSEELGTLMTALSAGWCRMHTASVEDRQAGRLDDAEAAESLRDRIGQLQASETVWAANTRARKDHWRHVGQLDAEQRRAPQPPFEGKDDRDLVSYRAAYWRGYKAALPKGG